MTNRGHVTSPQAELDPVLKSSARESIFVFLVWLSATVYSVSMCYWLGYDNTRPVSYMLGVPLWIFWGVLLPWVVCIVVSWWFAYFYMTDEYLGDQHDTDDLV